MEKLAQFSSLFPVSFPALFRLSPKISFAVLFSFSSTSRLWYAELLFGACFALMIMSDARMPITIPHPTARPIR